jgi:integrase
MKIRWRQTRPGQYQVYFTWQGKRIFIQRDALGEPLRDMNQVKCIIGQIKGNGYDPADWNWFRKVPFDRTIRNWVKNSSCSPDWQRKRERIVENTFIPFFQKQDVSQIGDDSIEAFKKSLEARSKKTQRNYMAELKSFFKWMSCKKLISQIPEFKPIRYIPKHNPHWYTKATQAKLFEFTPDLDKPILTFLRWTGCRPNEARGLQKKDVDWSTNQIYIRHALSMDGKLKGTKTENLKTLPIFPEIEECLKPNGHSTFVFSRRGRPYSRRMLEKAWKRMVKLANQQYDISILPLYQGTKHSLGNQMINEEGRSLSDVQAVFGHSDIRSTMIYAQTRTSRLAEIMGGRSHFVHTVKTKENQQDMAGVGGFEPPSPGSKDLCLTA